MTDLYHKLLEYCGSDVYPFHMPGHKRRGMDGPPPFRYDITEIDGFDNLHEPETVIREEMERARRFYQSDQTYFLVNGSTCGLLAAICASTFHGEKILVARNCHKAVYHAIFLNNLKPTYLYPEMLEEFGFYGGISPQTVKEAMEADKDRRVVVLTSPTYEGMVSDIRRIADLVHERDGILIVDEAHGAHFGMHPVFPESALQNGADLVIQSLHKTLPSLTQTALLHLRGERINKEKIEQYLKIFQTSSPSYVLMASMTSCIRWLSEDPEADRRFGKYAGNLSDFYEKAAKWKRLRLVNRSVEGRAGVKAFDPSKLVISVRNAGVPAKMVYDRLRDYYHLQMEMCTDDYLIAMTSVMDTEEGFLRFEKALQEIDETMFLSGEDNKKEEKKENREVFFLNEKDKKTGGGKSRLLAESEGFVCKEYLYLYPPGIPIAVPGERVTGEMIQKIQDYQKAGLRVYGVKETENGMMIDVEEES